MGYEGAVGGFWIVLFIDRKTFGPNQMLGTIFTEYYLNPMN